METDFFYMEKAIELASKAILTADIPVGCVIVEKSTGNIIGEGYNTKERDNSPLGHAEINAIQDATKNLGTWRLSGCVLYVTLEPCPMCCGAIINSRLDRVVFGADDEKTGCLKSVMNMFEFPFNHKPFMKSGVLKDECSKILSDFFENLRK